MKHNTSWMNSLSDEGALPAFLEQSRERAPDRTSFVTALGLRALRRRSGDAMKKPMLDFLETCEVADPPGAFAFWPNALRPAWAECLPADADDTALCLTELFLAGGLTRSDTVRRFARLILPNRVRHDGTFRPAWIPEGAFVSWLTPERGPKNIVDCAVNANILALMAVLAMNDPPGRSAAVRLIREGLDWAGKYPQRLRALTPFYPEPAEFRLAVEHAVACGCADLAPAASRLRHLTGTGLPAPNAVLCSAAYGATGWRSPALAALRRAMMSKSDTSETARI